MTTESMLPREPWWMFSSRASQAGLMLAIAVFAAFSVLVQQARDRRFATEQGSEEILYVQSPAVMKRLALSYDTLLSDVYWIRALQHFGWSRKTAMAAAAVASDVPPVSPFEMQFPMVTSGLPFPLKLTQDPRYRQLYPLLNITTTLDPYFSIAYRFGAIFLSEAPPGGPGRSDLAIALLEKGITASPQKWQYYLDLGFVYYWARQDYVSAAHWFERASTIPGSAWWLKPLAANTLAVGGDRRASRQLYSALAKDADNDFVRNDARRRLRQLEALDQMDALRAVVAKFKTARGEQRIAWPTLIGAGLLRDIPRDPDGYPLILSPSGDVSLDPSSSLNPLPTEPAAAAKRPPA